MFEDASLGRPAGSTRIGPGKPDHFLSKSVPPQTPPRPFGTKRNSKVLTSSVLFRNVYLYVCVYIYANLHCTCYRYVYMYMYTCVRVCACVCVYVCVYVYLYVYA